jgi:hypothetical protein
MPTIGRRALFFGAVAAASQVLFYPTPPAFRWVCVFTASLAGFWAIAFAAEDLSGPSRPRERPKRRMEAENPFAPPPPPGD